MSWPNEIEMAKEYEINYIIQNATGTMKDLLEQI